MWQTAKAEIVTLRCGVVRNYVAEDCVIDLSTLVVSYCRTPQVLDLPNTDSINEKITDHGNSLSWWEDSAKTVYANVNKTTLDLTNHSTAGNIYGPYHCVLYRQQLP